MGNRHEFSQNLSNVAIIAMTFGDSVTFLGIEMNADIGQFSYLPLISSTFWILQYKNRHRNYHHLHIFQY